MRLKNLDLNLLIALHYLIEECNVTRAAERMYISQPAMSATLNRIRKMLDDEILIRVGSRMQTTPFAESLRTHLASILNEIDILLTSKPEFDPSQETRRFRIGASDYIILIFLRHVLTEVSKIAPGVTLEIVPVGTDYVESLLNGELDFLILPEEVTEEPEKLSSSRLFLDEFVGISGKNNEIENTALTVETFAELPYVAYQVNGSAGYVDRKLAEYGILPSPEMTTESFLIVPFIVDSTQMVTIIHKRLVSALKELTSISTIDLPFSIPPINQALFWNPRFDSAPDFVWLRGILEQFALELRVSQETVLGPRASMR